MSRSAFNPDVGDTAEFPKLKEQYGEDPGRFLQSSKDLAEARIRGIRKPELLEAYRAVARNILSGSDLEDALGYIDKRERELTGEPIETTLEPTPVPATDGGVVESEPDTDEEPEQLHPDVRGLESGQVLVVDRGEKTEYVFPTTDAAESAYISRAYDDDTGGLWMELDIDADDFRSRLDNDHEFVPVDEIAVDAPSTAALGGDSK